MTDTTTPNIWTLHNVLVRFPKASKTGKTTQYHNAQIWKQYRNRDDAEQYAKQFREMHPDVIAFVSTVEY